MAQQKNEIRQKAKQLFLDSEGLMSNQEMADNLKLSLPIVKQAIRIVSEKSGLSRSDFAAIL